MGVSKCVQIYDWIELILGLFTMIWFWIKFTQFDSNSKSFTQQFSIWFLSFTAQVRVVLASCSLLLRRSKGAVYVIMMSRMMIHFASIVAPILLLQFGECCEHIIPTLISVVPYGFLTPFYYWPALTAITPPKQNQKEEQNYQR